MRRQVSLKLALCCVVGRPKTVMGLGTARPRPEILQVPGGIMSSMARSIDRLWVPLLIALAGAAAAASFLLRDAPAIKLMAVPVISGNLALLVSLPGPLNGKSIRVRTVLVSALATVLSAFFLGAAIAAPEPVSEWIAWSGTAAVTTSLFGIFMAGSDWRRSRTDHEIPLTA